MKRKRYGWGLIPTSWKGWVYVVMQVAVIIVVATFLPAKPAQPTTGQLLRFFAVLVLVVGSMILFSTISAPAPHWRWGKKPTDNPKEDF